MALKSKIIMFNGIPILYRKNKVNNTTDVVFGITSGAFGENKIGVAHFYEHMMFKQTKTKDLKTLGAIISDETPHIGAATGYDRMYIYSNFSTRKIDQYLSVMSDMYFHSKNAQEDVDKECNVICQEISRVENDAHRKIYSAAVLLASGEKRFLTSPCGNEKSVKQIKTKDLLKFREENFFKENFIFSIYTNKSVGYVKKLVSTYILPNLQSKPNENVKLADNCVFEKKNGLMLFTKQDVTKNNVNLSFNGFCADDELKKLVFNFYVYSSIIKMKGRLWNIMREKESLVYSTPRCYADIYRKDGLITFTFETTKQNIKRCIEIWADMVKDFAENGLTKEEYDYCQNQMILDKDFDYEKPEIHAKGMFVTYAEYKKLFKHNEQLDKALKLDFETVNKVVKQIFVPKKVWLSCFGNADKTDVPNLKKLEEMFIK